MRDGWTQYKMGELVSLKQGFALNKKSDHHISEVKTAYPLLKISDLLNNIESLYVKDTIPKQFLVKPSEIIYSRTGQVGYAFMGRRGVIYNNCFKVTPNNLIDNTFLLHLLNSQPVRELARVLATGTAQPDLNHGAFKSIKVTIPPLPTQKKIANILSAYDDLIENNIKRIELLEEQAQLIYEEWFVRMRFPNYENTKIDAETGLPEGWEHRTFADIVDINPKTSIKKGVVAPFIPMGSISTSSMIIDPIEERAVSGGTKFKNGDTLFARITPCLENGKTGFVQFMKDNDSIATGSTEFIVLRETSSCGKYFIYCTSREEGFRENAIKSMVGSDGRQRVNTDCFEKYMVNFAPNEVRLKFEKLCEPMFRSIQIFIEQNNKLREARDILLPRLMMGIIEV
ncbi:MULTISPECIES: restriction endonuclease subunit S [unclassified Psychrobacter]|uniref:restriction endonuclease subunit S n=1 Tax=unclassified Psychrobacter TaxID=196806 RepID=UPI003F4479D7